MFKALITLAFVAGFFGNAHAQPIGTTRYTILLDNGTVAGEQIVERPSEDLIKVHFDFKENGRGPTLDEVIRLGPDQMPREYRVTGTSEMGAAVDERFVRNGNLAEWSSKSERGSKRVRGKGFYLPLDSSWQVNSLMIQGAFGSRQNVLPLLPDGRLQQQRLDEVAISHDGQDLIVQLLMHTGIGLSPQFFWATTDPEPYLFAVILPGNHAVIKEGWQSALPELKRSQEEAAGKLLARYAQELMHPLTGLTVIRNARIFDAISATLTAPSDVYVLRGKITAIFPAGTRPGTVDNEIDATGRVMLPGLFDMHAHINRWSAMYHLTAGVTSVRDLGNSNPELQAMIDEAEDGRLMLPRLIPAGFVDGKSPYSSHDGFLINNAGDIRRAVDWYALRGYSHLKIYNSFPPDLLTEVVSYAHLRGMKISGHVPAFIRADDALDSGFDELHHVNQLLLNFLATPETDTRTLARFYLPAEKVAGLDLDSPPVKAFIERLKERGTVVDPTLTAFDFIKQRDGDIAEPFRTIANNMPPDVRRSFRMGVMNIPNDETAKRYEASYRKMVDFVGRLYKAGVPLVAGTDALAGFSLHSELALYVKAGLTPAQAIQVATLNGAKFTGTLHERGTIAPGKLADLILIDGDPTKNIEDIRKVALVLTRGKLIYPNEINTRIGVKPFVTAAPKLHRLEPRPGEALPGQ